MKSDTIFEIIKSSLDANGCIPLQRVEELLNKADFNLEEETGISSVSELMQELEDDFNLETVDNNTIVRYLHFKSLPIGIENEPTGPISDEEQNNLNRKIGGVIRKLLKESPDAEAKVPLTALGQELNSQKLKTPNGEKISAYLKRFPNLFEVLTIGTDTFVRNSEDKNIPIKTASTQVSTGSKYVSMYIISDFAFFPDYKGTMKELSEIAMPDGWFILPNASERNPYLLLDSAFKRNFALLVNKQIKEGGTGIIMRPDRAEFNTGFKSIDGKDIIAHFIFNQQRDNTRWQNWVFSYFSYI